MSLVGHYDLARSALNLTCCVTRPCFAYENIIIATTGRTPHPPGFRVTKSLLNIVNQSTIASAEEKQVLIVLRCLKMCRENKHKLVHARAGSACVSFR